MKAYQSLFILLLVSACNVNTGRPYEPVDGYMGKVKSISLYEYENEIEKTKRESAFGRAVPTSYTEYSEDGGQLVDISIDLEDDLQHCIISLDSTMVDKEGIITNEVHYNIYANSRAVANTKDIRTIISSDSAFVFKSCVNHKRTKESNIEKEEIIYTYLFDETKKIQIAELPFPFTAYEALTNGKKDTTYLERVYDGDFVVEEREIIKNEIISSTCYEYDDNKLVREIKGEIITQYDDQGRIISVVSPNIQRYYSYKDTTSIESTVMSGFYCVSYIQKDHIGNVIQRCFINLGAQEKYLDEAITLLERFRDGEINKETLSSELQDYALKSESNSNSISFTIFDEYDDFGNPLLAIETVEEFSCNYSYLPKSLRYYEKKDLYKSQSRTITEKEITYYQ